MVKTTKPKKQAFTAWILYPYATTRSWGHAMLFRSKEAAESYAEDDAFYVVPKQVEITLLEDL